MTFNVKILNKSQGWINADGDFVFPLNFSDKLDKTLDECVLTCYNSNSELYKINSKLKITLSDGTNTKTYIYIVADDDSIEFPNGSGHYKHSINIVEATKYTEGIMCQTVRFTNTLKQGYSPIRSTIFMNCDRPQYSISYSSGYFLTPSPSPYTAPNATSIANEVGRAVVDQHTDINAYTINSTNVQYSADNAPFETVTGAILAENNITLKYTITLNLDHTPTVYVTTYIVTVAIAMAAASQTQTKKYTIATVIDRIYDLAEPLFYDNGTPAPRFQWENNGIYAGQYDELDKIIAPEFSISQATLREQLQMVGGKIHAEPRVTDVTYLNGKYYYKIGWDYLHKGEKITLPADYIINKSKQSISNYATRLHTNVRNAVNSLSNANTVSEPDNNAYKAVRAEQANIRIADTNSVIKTFQPIYDLTQVKCSIYRLENGVASVVLLDDDNEPIYADITAYCFEATEYDSLLSSYSGAYPNTKTYALRWERYQKNITQLFYQAPNVFSQALSDYAIVNILSSVTGKSKSSIDSLLTDNKNQLVFQVHYKPVTNTAFIHGKNKYTDDEPFTIAYNQSDSLIEMDYYGENLRGTAARIGNPEKNITVHYNSLANLPKCGQVVTVNNKDYAISEIQYEVDANRITASLGLTQDFNAISQYIGVDSRKRISEISQDQASERDIVIPTKVIFGTIQQPANMPILLSISAFEDIFRTSPSDSRITQALITRNGTNNRACLPAIASGYGTSTVLTTSMKDNYSAGESESYLDVDDESISGFWQYDYRFGDYFGRADYLDIFFGNGIDDTGEYAFTYPSTVRTHSQAINRAILQGKEAVYTRSSRPYYCRKDSNEALTTISVVMEIQTTIDGVTLGSAMSKLNSYVTNKGSRVPHLYLIPNNAELPYKLDDTIIDYDRSSWIDLGTVTIHNSGYLNTKTATSAGKGYVVAFPVTSRNITVDVGNGITQTQTIYEGGEIVFLYGKPVSNGATLLGQNYQFTYIM